MAEELLDIRPHELKFTFELRKQSSCSIQLGNKTDQYVAFKVKTTSPKKYCVRPNIGIIKPNGASDFTVTMQAPQVQVAPPVLQCRDKFLIQGTVVPFGTSEEDITADVFDKESGKYIEERKIKVVLTSPVESPSLLPVSGERKQELFSETTVPKDVSPVGVEDVSSPLRDPEGLDVSEELKELKTRLSLVDSNLKEAELTISRLTEEKNLQKRERDALKRDLEMLRKTGGRAIQVGFPFLYVCMVALVALAIGYIVHP